MARDQAGGRRRPAEHHDGQEGADEELARASVGPVVEAVGARPASKSTPWWPPRPRPRSRGRPSEDLRRTGWPAQQQGHRHREDEVELLLDRQRPEVLHRGRAAEEVARRSRSLTMKCQLRDLAPGRRPRRRGGRRAAAGGHRSHRRATTRARASAGGGEQASEPAPPEPAEVDRPPRVVLAEQQRGDQEAGQREEEGDAEEAAGNARDLGVEQQHRAHRQGADTVEAVDAPTKRTVPDLIARCASLRLVVQPTASIGAPYRSRPGVTEPGLPGWSRGFRRPGPHSTARGRRRPRRRRRCSCLKRMSDQVLLMPCTRLTPCSPPDGRGRPSPVSSRRSSSVRTPRCSNAWSPLATTASPPTPPSAACPTTMRPLRSVGPPSACPVSLRPRPMALGSDPARRPRRTRQPPGAGSSQRGGRAAPHRCGVLDRRRESFRAGALSKDTTPWYVPFEARGATPSATSSASWPSPAVEGC